MIEFWYLAHNNCYYMTTPNTVNFNLKVRFKNSFNLYKLSRWYTYWLNLKMLWLCDFSIFGYLLFCVFPFRSNLPSSYIAISHHDSFCIDWSFTKTKGKVILTHRAYSYSESVHSFFFFNLQYQETRWRLDKFSDVVELSIILNPCSVFLSTWSQQSFKWGSIGRASRYETPVQFSDHWKPPELCNQSKRRAIFILNIEIHFIQK